MPCTNWGVLFSSGRYNSLISYTSLAEGLLWQLTGLIWWCGCISAEQYNSWAPIMMVIRVFVCNNFSLIKSFCFPWAVKVQCIFTLSCRCSQSLLFAVKLWFWMVSYFCILLTFSRSCSWGSPSTEEIFKGFMSSALFHVALWTGTDCFPSSLCVSFVSTFFFTDC
jgi:hypothetical protein